MEVQLTAIFAAVPPFCAFLYALIAAVFFPFFGEGHYSTHLLSIVPRALLLAVVIALVASPIDNDASLIVNIVVLVMGAFVSAYLMQDTRRSVVEGGPPPPQPIQIGGIYVVTGANTGIGKETAAWLACKGAHKVVMCCRNTSKAQDAVADILLQHSAVKEDQFDIVPLDLSSLTSIRQAVDTLLPKYDKIDCLINNAGVMMGKQCFTDDKTKDGQRFELVMQANYLGHYLLTRLLLPRLKNARILNVTSSTYAYTRAMDLDDLFCTKGRKYTLFHQYSMSKLANILFTKQLAKLGYWSASIHPGMVRTDVTR